MKAWELREIKDISLTEREIPTPSRGEVLIKVKAAGICGSDIPRIYENGAHKMPLIPGHEFSGIVEDTGEDVSEDLAGKRVGIFPLIPCDRCAPCRSGHPEMCRDYDYIGSRRDGAFAEYVTVPASNLIELPDGVGFEEAAMLEPMAVAVHAMRMTMEESTGDREKKIVICGLGPIGLMLLMFLSEHGYRNIYVTGNKDIQKERAAAFGIHGDNYCDSRRECVPEWIMQKTGTGADVYFECVGKNDCVTDGIESAAPGGTVLVIGNPYSDMTFPRDIYWKILRNQLTVRGTWNSTFLKDRTSERNEDDWHYVINKLKDKKIDPSVLISHRFSIENLEKGFWIMRDKTEDHCKIMMVI
ncbi:MAG: galactitol-1-phosphate 5-dehydrogenase [Lachnospiraceae bacterium]|nr:galactitol-1-phosphate 5-dehydrogenase [Lachnospiraceae bacterium]